MGRRPIITVSLLLWLGLAGASSFQDNAQTALHLLDYIAVDYGEAVAGGQIKNAGEYQEMREFAAQTLTLIERLPAHSEHTKLLTAAQALAKRIEAKETPAQIAAQANELRWSVIDAYQVRIAPKSAVDLDRGAQLYSSRCAGCHGAAGAGDGPAGQGLEPAPSNFRDSVRMAQRSLYGLYNTISLGVVGTGMSSYAQLSDEDRWALAFFVAGFAADETAIARGATLWRAGAGRAEFPDLTPVATLSAAEVKARLGDDAAAIQAYLRSHPQALTGSRSTPVEFAVAAIGKSAEAYRRGAREEAMDLAISAYLEGFELIEANLRSADAQLMERTEREMMNYRSALQSAAPIAQIEQHASNVQALLSQARAALDDAPTSYAAAFVSSLVILLREGAEAILVLAAILAFLAKAERKDARRWVHAGWVAALILGAATWAVSSYLVEISGASREITEGVAALISAAMLIYVGYWLHNKSHADAWRKFIKDQVGGALSARTLWALAAISFLAVYREMFETVLFYQVLAAQTGPEGYGALLAGVAVAAVSLAAIAWLILRASKRLPIGPFFSVSSLLLIALAVVFAGQGVAALQEAGWISVHAVQFFAAPMLGTYPTVQTLAAQLAVILLAAAGFWRLRRMRRQESDARVIDAR